jgi:hypothetical protein
MGVLSKVDDVSRSVAAGIVAGPGYLADRGGRLPTDHVAVWFAILLFLPITLPLSAPFWLASWMSRKIAGENKEK